MTYFTSSSRWGRVRYGAIHWRISVDDSLINPQRIGDASEVGIPPDGLAIWQLRVHGVDVPGLWIAIDGCFVPFVPIEEVRD
jgi:hypothetical protein